MAIVVRNAGGNYSNLDGQTYAQSVIPVAGEMLVVFAHITNGTGSNAPTVSDDKGHTWTARGTQVLNGTRQLNCWTAPDNAVYTAALISVDWHGGATVPSGGSVMVLACTGIDTTSNDGVVQSTNGSGTSTTAQVGAMSAFGTNAVGVMAGVTAVSTSPSSTSLVSGTFGTNLNGTLPTISIADAWGGDPTTPSHTPNILFVASGAFMAIALEMKAAIGGAVTAHNLTLLGVGG